MKTLSTSLLPHNIDQTELTSAMVHARVADKPFLIKQFTTLDGKKETLVFFGTIVMPYRHALIILMNMETLYVKPKDAERLMQQLLEYWGEHNMDPLPGNRYDSLYTKVIRLMGTINSWIHPRIEQPKAASSLERLQQKNRPILKLFYEASEAHK